MRYEIWFDNELVLESDTLEFTYSGPTRTFKGKIWVRDTVTRNSSSVPYSSITLQSGDWLRIEDFPELPAFGGGRRSAYKNQVKARPGTKYEHWYASISGESLIVANDADGSRREFRTDDKFLRFMAGKINAPTGEVAFTDDDYESMLYHEGCITAGGSPSIEETARALFRTDPRIMQLVEQMGGDVLDRAWERERAVRGECLARAEAMWKT